MVDVSRTLSKDHQRIRVLSLDGGGIYGLIGAIWLRKLCEGNPRFLDGNDVDLFAGCSSGAINALLLASKERPRDAILSGELERFWTSPGIFANTRPLRYMMSHMGLRSWFSDVDLLDQLRGAFGDLELGELPHHVHISTFNWTGSGKLKRSRAGQGGTRHWKPKFFGNIFPDDEDFDDPVAEIAYAAATPPMFRPMRNGLGDGASFNGNPSVSALAQVVRAYHVHADGSIHVLRSKLKLSKEGAAENVGAVLARVALVSMGSGQQLPYYFLGDIDFGSLFTKLPSNIFTGVSLASGRVRARRRDRRGGVHHQAARRQATRAPLEPADRGDADDHGVAHGAQPAPSRADHPADLLGDRRPSDARRDRGGARIPGLARRLVPGLIVGA